MLSAFISQSILPSSFLSPRSSTSSLCSASSSNPSSCQMSPPSLSSLYPSLTHNSDIPQHINPGGHRGNQLFSLGLLHRTRINIRGGVQKKNYHGPWSCATPAFLVFLGSWKGRETQKNIFGSGFSNLRVLELSKFFLKFYFLNVCLK